MDVKAPKPMSLRKCNKKILLFVQLATPVCRHAVFWKHVDQVLVQIVRLIPLDSVPDYDNNGNNSSGTNMKLTLSHDAQYLFLQATASNNLKSRILDKEKTLINKEHLPISQ